MQTSADELKTKLELLLKESNPNADFSPGSVLSELVGKLTAVAQLDLRNETAKLSASSTVKAVLDATEDTFNPIIDKLASNYDTYRNEGKKSVGRIKVFVSQNKTYFIPKGLTFTQPNLLFNYVTTAAYTISTASNADLKLKAEGASFYFIVPVEAVDAGLDNNVATGTKFTISTNDILPELVNAEAYGAFSSGQSKETDRELITRFKVGLATKNLVSSYAINSVLKDTFLGFKSASVIGVRDPEMKRASHNIFGIATPGKADVYVRSSTALTTVQLTLNGRRITSGADTGRWEIDIPANAAPGFYRVLSIIASKGGLAGTSTFHRVTYGMDTSLYTNCNELTGAKDARFTRYQTCNIVFNHESTETTAPFDLTLLTQPNLNEIQELFVSGASRIPCADYLVKAVVPCEVSVFLKLVKRPGASTIPVNSIKADIFSYINNVEIGEELEVSQIINICHNYDIKRVDLPAIVRGRIIVPYSTTDEYINLTGTDSLLIEDNLAKGISKKNTAFFASYYNGDGRETIGIEVE